VYPHLLQSLDNVELWYLGGKGVQTMIDSDTRFNQRGVQVLEYVDNVQELMKQCALTINPISGNRGSCRKVAESLAGGRVCVSTREGASGYLDLGFSSLLICEKTEDFTGPMLKLLEDVEYRRSLECLNEDQRYKLSWEYSQKKLLALYADLAAATTRP
jgi:glycosyltransferase involved in cell wall biosynthesis